MRSVIWVILLFVAAVVSAAVLSQNDGLVSIFWSGYRDIVAFSLLIIVLIVRPSGLLGTPEIRKV